MGYLNNTVVEVDAILTKRGRELLAKGAQYFNISQFALADDEIDYRLWNPNHSQGTNYYGEVIESMPILEAIPDERQMMKSKLVTLPKTTVRMPVIASGVSGNPILESGQQISIVPSTPNYVGANATFGYTCIVSNGDVLTLTVGAAGQLSSTNLPTSPVYLGDGSNSSVSVMGKNFIITARNQFQRDMTATVTIIGNETGGRTSFTVTVKKVTVPIIDSTSNTFLLNRNSLT
jgi:hypothetical protein